MEQIDPVNRDEFYTVIIWVIPQRLVVRDLFPGKFGVKDWIHREKIQYGGWIFHETNFANCETDVAPLSSFLVQLY